MNRENLIIGDQIKSGKNYETIYTLAFISQELYLDERKDIIRQKKIDEIFQIIHYTMFGGYKNSDSNTAFQLYKEIAHRVLNTPQEDYDKLKKYIYDYSNFIKLFLILYSTTDVII